MSDGPEKETSPPLSIDWGAFIYSAMAERFAWMIVLLIVVALLAGCDVQIGPAPAPAPCPPDGPCPYKTVPPMDLPEPLRASNYAGGSCYWAALESVMRWQGLNETADQWRKANRGGAYTEQVAAAADDAGLRFAYTLNGDTAFLDWASDTRRGAAITYGKAHAITFCGYNGGDAVLLDNNTVHKLDRVPRDKFLAAWRQAGGDAVTVVYSPSPPRPWR